MKYKYEWVLETKWNERTSNSSITPVLPPI